MLTASATRHGGQESTIRSFPLTRPHHGMIVVGWPDAFPGLSRLDEITGTRGERMPRENELEAARFQDCHVAAIAARPY